MAERTADIEQGRDAARRESWSEAYKALVAADPSDLSPQDLEALSEAAWWLSKIDEAIEQNPPFAELADSIERSTGTRRAAAVPRLFSMPEPDDLRGPSRKPDSTRSESTLSARLIRTVCGSPRRRSSVARDECDRSR